MKARGMLLLTLSCIMLSTGCSNNSSQSQISFELPSSKIINTKKADFVSAQYNKPSEIKHTISNNQPTGSTKKEGTISQISVSQTSEEHSSFEQDSNKNVENFQGEYICTPAVYNRIEKKFINVDCCIRNKTGTIDIKSCRRVAISNISSAKLDWGS